MLGYLPQAKVGEAPPVARGFGQRRASATSTLKCRAFNCTEISARPEGERTVKEYLPLPGRCGRHSRGNSFKTPFTVFESLGRSASWVSESSA